MESTIGVLLLNLGGPDSIRAVKPFLYNLFSDREIIRLGPSFMQRPLAWLISTLRAGRGRQMYSFIGGKSPINDITVAQAEALEGVLNSSRITEQGARSFRVYVGMRYWHPLIKDSVQRIHQDGVNELVVLSMYPHYSRTTTGSAIAEFKRASVGYGLQDAGCKIRYIESWYDFPPYIDALTEAVYEGISGFEGKEAFLLYSAHGLPLSFVREGDPYPEHIKKTVELLNKRLSEAPYNVKEIRWALSYQSKIGRRDWLSPSTEETIIRLSREGVRNLLIIPISFVSDNIETLYEIGIYYRDIAIKHRMNMRRCPSLNTSGRFIQALKELVMGKEVMGDG
ncbi:MAG: ferrochelatase [Thermodesulfovibrionia bacterium]